MSIISNPSLRRPTGQLSVRNRIAPVARAHTCLPPDTAIVHRKAPTRTARNRALFLDRDGVINIEQFYIHSREDFRFKDGIFELCRAAQGLGYLLVVVTNQSGIARGYYSESEFLELTQWMIQEFAQRNIQIARVYYCPYHPVYGVGRYKFDSADRKPRPGMLLRAQAELNLDLASSILIGDKWSDIGAAEAAGIGTMILVRSLVTEAAIQKDNCYVSDSLGEVQHRFFSLVSKDGRIHSGPVHGEGLGFAGHYRWPKRTGKDS